MREKIKRSWYLSVAGLISSSILLSSCSAPDRLRNDDLTLDQTKSIVKDRLISPVEDERIVEFNKKLPRRSILQVIHAPDSLTDPNFLQLIEDKLSDEVDFLRLQNEEQGIQEISLPEPIELSQEQKDRITSEINQEREKLLFSTGLELETKLFLDLTEIEEEVDRLFLDTIPLERENENFPRNIGATMTTDNEGYLSFPADLYLIGGENSSFTSKVPTLVNFIEDKNISLSVRELPIQDALDIIAGALDFEYTLSPELLSRPQTLSLSLQSSAISILDAVLTQNNLAILYDSSNNIARFYTDAELGEVIGEVKDAIRGYNQLLLAKRKYERAANDARSIKKMIALSQELLVGNYEAFESGVATFPRSTMGEIARRSLLAMNNTESTLSTLLLRLDRDSLARLEPTSTAGASSLRNQSLGKSLSDILVESACITKGSEIFVEKIAVYNADSTDAKNHAVAYFDNNVPTDIIAADEDEENADEADPENNGQADDGTETDSVEEVATALSDAASTSSSGCEPYEIKFLEDSTGVIVTGRRQDNSLAVRILEEYDVPKLQVLIEIFMVTVSRNFSREISNLITRATGGVGGNGLAEAALANGTITTPNGSIQAESLAGIQNAVDGGYTVRLNSSKRDGEGSLISSALSFIESNQLGRVLSSPTILVEDGVALAEIKREQVAKVAYRGPSSTETDDEDNEVIVEGEEQVEDEIADFTLTLEDINVFPANRTVQMDVKIVNTRFVVPDINLITDREDADYTRDTIDTRFTASPGDVIVLAGLSANTDGTTTSGLPGTTGALAPVSPLLGGSDEITSNLNEMIIFMAPTVIDPSSDFQPHSAFGTSKLKQIDETSDSAEDADDETAESDEAN